MGCSNGQPVVKDSLSWEGNNGSQQQGPQPCDKPLPPVSPYSGHQKDWVRTLGSMPLPTSTCQEGTIKLTPLDLFL